MKDRFQNRFYKKTIQLLTNLIPSRSLRHTLRLAFRYLTYNEFLTLYKNRINKNSEYTYEIALLACMKNEADYLCEWLEYYKLIGVEHFFLYDNESTDDTYEKLKPYINEELVSYVYFEGKSKQMEMYNDALKRYQGKAKWLVVVDVDEFLQPIAHKNLKDFLMANENSNQLIIPWMLFGDSEHKTKPQGLVIENFINRATDEHNQNKSIVKFSEARMFVSPHEAIVFDGTKKISSKEIRCNHYYGKSEEEFIKTKQSRGDAYNHKSGYSLDVFHQRNKNEVFDNSMCQYAEEIKAELLKRDIQK